MRATPDDLVGMAFFARVVEARSFSDAARALGVSKSAVSARVARLEERLGVRLLHRTTRRLALTADGVRLYERCARVVAEADEAAEILAGASAVPRGVLRVHASGAFAKDHLVAPIASFMRAYPAVKVELRLADRPPDLAADGVDVAVVVARRLADSSLSVRKLASARVVACAAPSYLRRRGIPFRPQDLVLHDCLAYLVRDADEWRFQTDEGAVSMMAGAALGADDGRFLRDAALEGAGIAVLPEFLVADDLAAGRLFPVLDDFHAVELAIHALHPHANLVPANVRAFVDHLAACFRTPAWQDAARRASARVAGATAAPSPSPSPRTSRPPSKRASGAASAQRAVPMTEQDIRRLGAVASIYEGVDAAGASRLRETLARVKVTLAAKLPRTTVTMNSRVVCRDGDGAERELSLAYPWDARADRVSVLAPLGASLLGASVGAKVRDADRTLTLAAIPYQPEAAGDHHL
jgi:DNA-binding transcriptional LysR family regulator/transcription elongation GreA/GreB family factor